MTRHLSENNEKEKCAKSLNSAAWMASNSELTPSESLASTDDVSFQVQKLVYCQLFPSFQFTCMFVYSNIHSSD